MNLYISIYLLSLILFLISFDFLLVNEEFLIAITLIIFFILVYSSLRKVVQTFLFFRIDNVYFSLFFLINSILALNLKKLFVAFSFYSKYNFFLYRNFINYVFNLIDINLVKRLNILNYIKNIVFFKFSIDYLHFLSTVKRLIYKNLTVTMMYLSFYENKLNTIFI